jgi:hypothetical protein
MSSSKKSTLQSKFLAGLPGEERERIFARTSKLSEALREWVVRYPELMRERRVGPLCLTLVAPAPFLDVSALLPAVDDMLDEHTVPADKLWPLLKQCRLLLDNPQAVDIDAVDTEGVGTRGRALLESLRDIRAELAGFPLFELLRPRLVKHLGWGLRSMRRELEYITSPHPPRWSFYDYLAKCGIHTIGFFPVYLCLLITMGDESVPEHLDELIAIGREAAIGIRLANDIRSYERELAEGKFNSLGLLQREFLEMDHGLGPEEALEKVRVTVKDYLMPNRMEYCSKLGQTQLTRTSRAECYITDLVAFVCDFYAHHDYHHTLVRQDGHDIDARTSS